MPVDVSRVDFLAPSIEHQSVQRADFIAPSIEHQSVQRADFIAPSIEHQSVQRADFLAPSLTGFQAVERFDFLAPVVPPPEPEPEPEPEPVTINNPNKEATLPEAPTYTQAEAAALLGQRLGGLDWNLPSQRQTVTLDGTVYEARITYRRRLADWRLDLFTLDGQAVIRNRRLTPGWSPNASSRSEGTPSGVLVIPAIEDPYNRDRLGRELHVTFYPARRLRTARGDLFGLYEVEVK